MAERLALTGAQVFDGTALRNDVAVVIEADKVVEVAPLGSLGDANTRLDMGGDILAPHFVDLQVNGGGGVMLNDATNAEGLATITRAHRAAGSGHILPTLITDTQNVTRAAIDAVADNPMPEVAGLHLEGPHFARSKHGAHRMDLVRPMEQADLELYLEAATRLPRLMITLAPEAVTPSQIASLVDAGVIVSLGHSAADYDRAQAAFAAGARMATHLFNAMPAFHHRAPGLVGAALANGAVAVGLIADGLHVHPAALGAATRAKAGYGEAFLVTDAMAPFGTDLSEFELSGRPVQCDGPRLTLSDGTLAGANTDMLGGIRILVEQAAVPLELALKMATRTPANSIGLDEGVLAPGSQAPIRIAADLSSLRPMDA